MANFEDLKKYRKVHMIGIGGVSMSGIAEILKNWGFTVTGSDRTRSEITDKLIEDGIHVEIGHNPDLVNSADLVIYTAAIKEDDPELQRANASGIKTMARADFLGLITRIYENTICISGTHGKTTTTSMVSLCFLEDGKDPSIQVGGNLREIEGNYRVGNSDYFVLESCEYTESFLKFYPKAAIVLNIDNDHLDYFKNIENINNAFIKFVELIPSNGLLVANADNKYTSELHNYAKCKCISYGIEKVKANYVAKNISFDKNGFGNFDVYHNDRFFCTISLSVPGIQNVSNALGCVALCDSYGIDKSAIKSALKKYTGTGRRFEYKGEINGASIYDDYGHHPTEIKAVATSLKNMHFNKSWVVFQPHTFSRTKNLMDDFVDSLLEFDNIIVTDVYAAREKDTYGVNSLDIVTRIKAKGRKAVYIPSFDEIVKYLKSNVKENDVIITQGAGTVTEIGPMLLDQ